MRPFIILFVELIRPGWSSHICKALSDMAAISDLVTIESEEIFCDHQNICRGIHIAGGDELISCDYAFRIVTERNRRELSLPPIIWESSDEDEDWIEDDEAWRGASSFIMSDSSQLMRLPRDTSRLFKSFEKTAELITSRISKMYPQLVYSEEIDGTLLRKFTSLAMQLVLATRSSKSVKVDDLSDLARKSEYVRDLAWYVIAMLNKISSVTMHETEIFMASMAPWIHAFMYVQYQIHFWYPKMFQGNTWIFTAISKYHPLYDNREDVVWYLLMPFGSLDLDEEIIFQRHAFVDGDTADDVMRSSVAIERLFEGRARLNEPPRSLVRRLFRHIEMYLRDASLSVDDIDEFASLAEISSVRIIQVLTYALECQYEESVTRTGGSPKSLFVPPVSPELFDPNNIVSFIETANVASVGIDSTIAAMIRIFGNWMTPHTRLVLFKNLNFLDLRLSRNPAHDSSLYLKPESGLNKTVRAMMRMDLEELSSTTLLRSKSSNTTTPQMYRKILEMFVSTELNDLIILVPAANTSDSSTPCNYPVINPVYADVRINNQIAIGRFLAKVLDTRFAKSALVGILVGSPTIFQTLFFNSFHVRKGFYDVMIDRNIEEFFESGFELVEALTALD